MKKSDGFSCLLAILLCVMLITGNAGIAVLAGDYTSEQGVEADFFEVDLKKGDHVLMCSDGLTNMVDDDDIAMIVKAGRDVVQIVEELIRVANHNGGKDNIAVVIIEPFADEVR